MQLDDVLGPPLDTKLTVDPEVDTAFEVAREDLAARQENARLSEEQFKRGVLLTSQRDASHAQAMKAQAGFLEASLDYLLTRDELTRTLGRTAP